MKRDLDLMRNIMFQLEEPKFLRDNISAFSQIKLLTNMKPLPPTLNS